MKLSMWMIANQISDLDIKLQIREDAAPILNSARLAYATNCVHIFRENDTVVCDGEGDRIIFYDMEITRVFELVQSIFDAHQDWIDSVKRVAEQQDYQRTCDIAHILFKNPLVIFDANNKVLGMSSAYGENELDNEWSYLKRYGYSSINAINMIKYTEGNREFYGYGKVDYEFPQNSNISLGGISSCIYFNNIICGRVNLIAKERSLNPGDAQLLQSLIDVLQTAMGKLLIHDVADSTSSSFLSLMFGKACDPERLKAQLEYQGWKEDDIFYVTIVRYVGEETDENLIERHINSLMRMLIYNMNDVVVNAWGDDLILLSTRDLSKDKEARTLFRNLVVHNPVWVGFSLPNQNGILEIARFYRQADYALKCGTQAEKPKMFQLFETYALHFILMEPAEAEDKAAACMPSVLKLWRQKKQGEAMFRTLLCFLEQERSIAQTAKELYLHRNTAVYRIKKIEEQLGVDLDDLDVRRYCYVSAEFLDAYERMQKRGM